MSDKILEVSDLQIRYVTDEETVRAVNGVSFTLERGESIGLVGETGAGKTTTALGIMGLVPDPPGEIVGGSILFEDQDLLKLPEKQMREILREKQLEYVTFTVRFVEEIQPDVRTGKKKLIAA